MLPDYLYASLAYQPRANDKMYSVDNGFLHVHEIIKEKLMEVTYVEA